MTTDSLQRIASLADAVHNLLDVAAAQQDVTLGQLKAVETATAQMGGASSRLKQSAETLQGELAKEVRQALQNVSKEAADLISIEFTTANHHAKQAAAVYRSAVKWAAWKVFAFAAGMLLLLVLAATAFVWLTVPSQAEVVRLRAERAELQASISSLERRGGRSIVSQCYENRLCVRVIGSTGQPYWAIVDGY